MQLNRTRREVATLTYLKKSDIKKLFKLSDYATNKVYEKANDLDNEEYGNFRPEPYKVRITSCCKVTKITLNQLLKQIEFEEKSTMSQDKVQEQIRS